MVLIGQHTHPRTSYWDCVGRSGACDCHLPTREENANAWSQPISQGRKGGNLRIILVVFNFCWFQNAVYIIIWFQSALGWATSMWKLKKKKKVKNSVYLSCFEQTMSWTPTCNGWLHLALKKNPSTAKWPHTRCHHPTSIELSSLYSVMFPLLVWTMILNGCHSGTSRFNRSELRKGSLRGTQTLMWEWVTASLQF